ncbi:protein of unknown function [Pseudonocardia thermophila]|uniref:DUF1206 domain-containing protein n=1 Tax=Pseudonocardia thermophila TaxID=1848 RepID=A0A1M6XV57_PSETH|nr:DUF1206 domain-containing protein [Pseudonocardia thermophila]SHL09844.1 protein of unknown function [Pseudonocardia thermophila]
MIRDLGTSVRAAARGGGDAPGRWVEVLGRAGIAAYGVVHVLIAYLVVAAMIGVRGQPAADQGGAVTVVAALGPVGRALLGVAAAGLVAFGVWQVCAAATGFRWVSGGERFRKRVGAAAKALAVFAVAAAVLPALLGERLADGDASVRSLTASLLVLPGGRVVVAAIGITAIAVAASMVYTAIRATYLGDLRERDLSPALLGLARWLGRAGNLGRAVALGGVGGSFVRAASTADPLRSAGFDGVLRALGTNSWGVVALALVAAGIAAFGAYCAIDAWARRA